ncbi:MAG: alpha/beta hydrolase [Verrucomicrobia bacterium]|nr:alpha/beta hydrolase [Verrucomicrobiota bacterium]MBU4289436.1 alpha/beta hydrolase [Verrucomicrobiota bacterium]MBU4429317.1 alpha/beta hydrolase [Verrucomicrobiota bacterium]MBU4497250.1 alpha/beta hydrolase [Verrucomicrobiota bacterium]MCG2679143.1 alpha/beta hydrolase [Kiritimatiellia bacterium]
MKTRLSIALIALAIVGGCESTDNPKRVDDITMAYWTYGEGYPLVMIMGFSGTMDMWDPTVITELSARHQVIVFDNRGMGKTTAGIREFTIEQFADDTAGLMSALGIEQAHVLGWSLGTEVAQELILRHPEKVNRLVLYAADCGGKEAVPSSDEVVRKMFDKSGTREEQEYRMFETLFPEDWLIRNRDYIFNLFAGMVRENVSADSLQKQWSAYQQWGGCYDLLPRIKCPTLLITGDQDINTPTANSPIMARQIAGVKLVMIAGGGHGVMYQYSQRFAAEVLAFLGSK